MAAVKTKYKQDINTLLTKFSYNVKKVLMIDFLLAFCHFLVLIQESNQRKSRKNNASARQAQTHPAVFSALRSCYFFIV
jgi:hypothetical protein